MSSFRRIVNLLGVFIVLLPFLSGHIHQHPKFQHWQSFRFPLHLLPQNKRLRQLSKEGWQLWELLSHPRSRWRKTPTPYPMRSFPSFLTKPNGWKTTSTASPMTSRKSCGRAAKKSRRKKRSLRGNGLAQKAHARDFSLRWREPAQRKRWKRRSVGTAFPYPHHPEKTR